MRTCNSDLLRKTCICSQLFRAAALFAVAEGSIHEYSAGSGLDPHLE